MRFHSTREKHGIRLFWSRWRVEFYWWTNHCHAYFEFGCDEGAGFSLALPPLGIWVHMPWPERFTPKRYSEHIKGWLPDERRCGVSIHDWTIRIALWERLMEWRRADPWWVRGIRLDIPEFMFGRMKHSEEEILRTDAIIPMPEGPYPCVIVMKREKWQRARLSWPSRIRVRAHIDCEKGVPHPGKGENSWDCGEDATYGLTCEANTIEEGISKFVESVFRDRRRYGGSVNWKPSASASA